MPNVKGDSSIFPLGVDKIEFMHNYEESSPGKTGDVILANYRNKLADAVLNLNRELSAASCSYDGETRVAAITVEFKSVNFGDLLVAYIPESIMDFIFYDDDAAAPTVDLLSLRPIDCLTTDGNTTENVLSTAWAGSSCTDYRYALVYGSYRDGNKVTFELKNPIGAISNNTDPALPDVGMGDFIASITIMRQG